MIFGECPFGPSIVGVASCLTRAQLEAAVLEVDAHWSWTRKVVRLCSSPAAPAPKEE